MSFSGGRHSEELDGRSTAHSEPRGTFGCHVGTGVLNVGHSEDIDLANRTEAKRPRSLGHFLGRV